jgi:hypothetical protein
MVSQACLRTRPLRPTVPRQRRARASRTDLIWSSRRYLRRAAAWVCKKSRSSTFKRSFFGRSWLRYAVLCSSRTSQRPPSPPVRVATARPDCRCKRYEGTDVRGRGMAGTPGLAEDFRAGPGLSSALPTFGRYTEVRFRERLQASGRYWIRTSDFDRVRTNPVLVRNTRKPRQLPHFMHCAP